MITKDDFHQGYDGSDRGGGQPIGFPELDALDALVDAFAKEMKAKLRKKYLDGYTGWDEPSLRPILELKLTEHVARGGQYVDVANLAAMLWNLDAPQEAAD